MSDLGTRTAMLNPSQSRWQVHAAVPRKQIECDNAQLDAQLMPKPLLCSKASRGSLLPYEQSTVMQLSIQQLHHSLQTLLPLLLVTYLGPSKDTPHCVPNGSIHVAIHCPGGESYSCLAGVRSQLSSWPSLTPPLGGGLVTVLTPGESGSPSSPLPLLLW